VSSPALVLDLEGRVVEAQEPELVTELAHFAAMPGARALLALPELAPGVGAPRGLVFALDPASAVLVPAAGGPDPHCGVRLHALRGVRAKRAREHRGELAKALSEAIPCGPGRTGAIALKAHELDQVGRLGARWAVERKLGREEDLARVEHGGRLDWADPLDVPADARIRAAPQLGTLGSGGHFLELAEVVEIFDEAALRALGLEPGGLVLTLHSGSRAFGHGLVRSARERLRTQTGVEHVPLASPAGRALLGALGAAANFALANRQVMTHRAREVLTRAFGAIELEVLFDAEHDGVRLERLRGAESERELLVHRHGATRALGPGHAELPPAHRALGSPVLLPGGPAQPSFLLLATAAAEQRTLASLPHASRRLLSPTACRAAAGTRDLARELARGGLSLRTATPTTLADELPGARVDARTTVELLTRLGLARPLARLAPFALVKG